MPISLNVTRGATLTPSTRVDHAVLNQIAAPLVEMPEDGDITSGYLDIPEVGVALQSFLSPINWLTHPNFWYDNWQSPDGRAEPVGTWSQNALTWYTNPTGAAVVVSRVESSPDGRSAYAAQLLGAAGCTTCDFGVFLPSNVAAQLRSNSLTFSLWVKNLTDAAINVHLAVCAASARDSVADCVEFDTSAAIALPNGEWTRATFTFAANDAATFQNGALLLLRTVNLTTTLKALHVAQGQLEIGTTPTTFQPPRAPTTPPEDDAIYPDSVLDVSASPFDVVLQNRNTGVKHYLAAPPAIFVTPTLGFNRATGRPQWIDPTGLKLVFEFTGTDQILTVPAGATSMTVHAWGAGGGNDAASETGLIKGGAGGYSRATFAVTPGAEYAVVVGEGAHGLNRAAYGFGGSGQGAAHQHNGGGLSGIFTGSVVTPVTAAALDEVLLVAGGGGAGGQSGGGGNASQGGNGNEATYSGGQSDLQGINASGTQYSGNGGGGGGWRGGSGLGLGGKGGSGIAHSAASPVAGQAHAQGTSTLIQAAVRPSLIVPGSTLDEYVAPAGQSGQPGLVVVIFA